MSILNIESLERFEPSAHEKSFEASSLENNHYHCEHGQTSSSGRHSCHNFRLRQLLLPAMLALGALLLAWCCVNWYGWGAESDNLVRRGLNKGQSQ